MIFVRGASNRVLTPGRPGAQNLLKLQERKGTHGSSCLDKGADCILLACLFSVFLFTFLLQKSYFGGVWICRDRE